MPLSPTDPQAFREGTVLGRLRSVLGGGRGADAGGASASGEGDGLGPVSILKGIGALLKKESQRAFREQRMGNVRWLSRDETKMNPNWPGILADFALGKAAPAANRFRGRPVLEDAGDLKRSVQSRVISPDTVECGSSLPYADALHRGGESQSVTITQTIQERLWNWMKMVAGKLVRAESAPDRREKREVSGAVKGDAELNRLRSELKMSRESYRGRAVPKGERERRQRLEGQVRSRRDAVAGAAAGASASMTGAEASKVGAAQKANKAATSLGWLLNIHLRGTKRTIKHPARPIVGLPQTLVAEIEAMLGVKVRAA